jgi:dephospho-CoA kinase
VIIIIVGMPGAGKDEFVKKAKEMGMEIVSMGDIVREYTKLKGLDLNNQNVGKIANEERKIHGMDVWAKRTVEKIKDKKDIVINGVRNKEEIEYFKKHFGNNIKVVAILSSESDRFERIKKRGREDDAKTLNEFKEREERELNWGLGSVIAMADLFIINDGTLEDFRKKVEDLLYSLKNK